MTCRVTYIVDLARALGAKPEVINPVKGCTPDGPACAACWAAALIHRLRLYPGLTDDRGGRPRFTGLLRIDHAALDKARKWAAPRVVFCNDLGDLFHRDVPASIVHQLVEIWTAAPHHLWIVPTHRAAEAAIRLAVLADVAPRNVMILISVETPAEARRKLIYAQALHEAGWRVGLSYEPALAPRAQIGWYFAEWIILGSISGTAAPVHPAPDLDAFTEMARDVRDFCAHWKIPFYLKQAPTAVAGRIIRNPTLDGREHRELPPFERGECKCATA